MGKFLAVGGIVWALVMAGAAYGESGHNPHSDSAVDIANAVVDAINADRLECFEDGTCRDKYFAPRKFRVCRTIGNRVKCSRVFLEAVE